MLALGGLGAAGGAYYMGVIPQEYLNMVGLGGDDASASTAGTKKERVEDDKKKATEETSAASVEKEEKKEEAAPEPVTVEAKEEPVVEEKEEEEPEQSNTIEHPEDGSRVDIAAMNSAFFSSVKENKANELAAAQEAALEAGAAFAAKEAAAEEKSKPSGSRGAEEALAELLTTDALANSQTLRAAHAALRSDMDDTYFRDMDGLSPAELKVRVVQLATEMGDRTKWEAVRLKEFLTMKEKEVGERYLEILQKQRLEFENLLGQKLREQEDTITRQANAALQAKEESIQIVLSAQKQAQDAERLDILETEEKRLTLQIEAQYSQQLDEELAKIKDVHAKELERLGGSLEGLREKTVSLESRLEVSRDYESGSKRAHRISAASLALVGKLETGEGAAVELAALEGAAGDEGVIASATSKIPKSCAKGVPTVADLQATFDSTYHVARQAAMVPEGRPGLDGQLLGILFAKLSAAPSPDAAIVPSSEEGNVADGVLSVAKEYVRLGDLDRAVEQLEKLKGQAAFAVRDWKSNAMDRVLTERALKVIKLECALLNKDVVGA